MNYKMVLRSIGILLYIEAACMIPSLLVSLLYRQKDAVAFGLSILVLFSVGLIIRQARPTTTHLYTRDGFAIVALGWILVPLFGALPFILSGAIPSVVDALFESVSGFSTTGASILREIESLPKGILFWRSFTQWMGGVGVLVLMIAILPSVRANNAHIMKAENPGPTTGKFVPKAGQAAKILYVIYIVLTLVTIIFLKLGGMSLYDSLIHAFSTASTGGFSNQNTSLAAYNSPYMEAIIAFFMLLFGINFALYYTALKGNLKAALKDEELHFYIGTIVVATLLIILNTYENIFQSIGETLRYVGFQIISIITSTGYTTADFNQWPVFSQSVLLLLMFIGASAGSTGGGLRCIRIIILWKIMKREIAKIIHPRIVHTVKINGRAIDEEVLSGITTFFFLYLFMFSISVIAVSLDGKDFTSSVTAVIATINNVGPGLGLVGPIGNYADFSSMSKVILSICMIIGRLEIYPILLLFAPAFWRKSSL